jgi:hypothetical protein
MADLEAIFRLIAERITPELRSPSEDFRHWVLLQDASGTDLAPLDEDRMPVHEVLDSLIRDGADAAAYITHRRLDPERVVAQVLVANPLNSDTRQADVVRRDGSVGLTAWQGPIS